MNRRRALLLGCAAAFAASGPARAATPFTTTEIAPGIYVRAGAQQDATVENQDGIANIGFIVGDRSVAVIDPGGGRADGEQLRARIQAVTDRPVSHVILSHVHPDHIFGAASFLPDAPVFVAHERMPPALAARGPYYRDELAELLGAYAAGDYVEPTMLVHGTAAVDLGGRTLSLHAHPTAHTDHDLSVLDEQTSTLWAADLLFVNRIPSLDGSVVGWLGQTQALRASAARLAVPGHGPSAVPWPEAAAAQERYLSMLVREVRAVIAKGGDIEQAVATVGQSARGDWLLFDDYNGRNVTLAFKELEWE
jgi:quinoprotein relay system zinc metallohydrolase 2